MTTEQEACATWKLNGYSNKSSRPGEENLLREMSERAFEYSDSAIIKLFPWTLSDLIALWRSTKFSSSLQFRTRNEHNNIFSVSASITRDSAQASQRWRGSNAFKFIHVHAEVIPSACFHDVPEFSSGDVLLAWESQRKFVAKKKEQSSARQPITSRHAKIISPPDDASSWTLKGRERNIGELVKSRWLQAHPVTHYLSSLGKLQSSMRGEFFPQQIWHFADARGNILPQ